MPDENQEMVGIASQAHAADVVVTPGLDDEMDLDVVASPAVVRPEETARQGE